MSQIFGVFAAVAFFTRIPCPSWVDYGAQSQRLAAGYAPLIGSMIGALAALVYWLAAQVLPSEIAIIAALVAMVGVTGALHEDGFADCCDGFGSPGPRERVLQIMHDPRCGSFAVVGVVLLLLSKIATLLAIVNSLERLPGDTFVILALVLINAQALSRMVAVSFIFTHRYVSDGRRAGAMTEPMSWPIFLLSLALGTAPLLGLAAVGSLRLASAALVLLPLTWLMGVYFQRRLNGYNGDCLGGAQQVAELGFYLAVCALLGP